MAKEIQLTQGKVALVDCQLPLPKEKRLEPAIATL